MFFRLKHDSDAFNRWDAGWSLARDVVTTSLFTDALTAPDLSDTAVAAALSRVCATSPLVSDFTQGVRQSLTASATGGVDPAWTALLLGFVPTESLVAAANAAHGHSHPRVLSLARVALRGAVASALHADVVARYDALTEQLAGLPPQHGGSSGAVKGLRSLRNGLLQLMVDGVRSGATPLDSRHWHDVHTRLVAHTECSRGGNFTDVAASLHSACSLPRGVPCRDTVSAGLVSSRGVGGLFVFGGAVH